MNDFLSAVTQCNIVRFKRLFLGLGKKYTPLNKDTFGTRLFLLTWKYSKLSKCQVDVHFIQSALSPHSVTEFPHDNLNGLDVSKGMTEVRRSLELKTLTCSKRNPPKLPSCYCQGWTKAKARLIWWSAIKYISYLVLHLQPADLNQRTLDWH